MNTNPRLLAVLLTGLAACQLSHDPEEGPIASASQALTTTCGAERWLGVTPSCGAVAPSWSGTSLFPGAALPLSLYCVYEWTAASPPTALDIAALPASGAGELAEDCPVAVPQSNQTPQSYDDLLASSLRASLQARVGTVDTVQAHPQLKTPIRVVVVDTAPDSGQSTEIHPGNDRHGDTLASVIRDIGCGSRRCGIEVVSALGLPWLDATTYSTAGGHVGRLSDVALAIYKGMNDAKAAREDHVIINLSLGWEDLPGLAECGEHIPSKAPTHAVYQAIESARCAGAIVISAAGNDAGGLTPPEGLMCPARWEALPITACGSHAGEPMVSAVGGVDYADRPITVTRPLGRPRLAAPSLGGIGWAATTSAPTPLTGTSVAAAVATGVAALVWSQSPGLSGGDVMDILHGSGVDLGIADTCPHGVLGPCDVRRISLCTSLAAAGVTGLNCSAPPALPGSSPFISSQIIAAAALDFSGDTGFASADTTDLSELPRYTTDSPALSGGVFPQPVVPVCPSCMFLFGPSGSTFYAQFAVPLDNASLVLETSTTRIAAALKTPQGSSSFAAGAYTIAVTGAPADVTSVWLTALADNGRTAVTEEIVATQ